MYTGIPAIPLCDNPSSKTKTAQPKHGAVKGSNLLLYLAVKPVLKNSPFFRDVAEPLQLCKYFLNKGVYHRFKRYRCCFCRNRRYGSAHRRRIDGRESFTNLLQGACLQPVGLSRTEQRHAVFRCRERRNALVHAVGRE